MTSGIPLCGLANHSGFVQFPILTEFQELVDQFQDSRLERSDYLEWQHQKDKERKAPCGGGGGEEMALEQELKEVGKTSMGTGRSRHKDREGGR